MVNVNVKKFSRSKSIETQPEESVSIPDDNYTEDFLSDLHKDKYEEQKQKELDDIENEKLEKEREKENKKLIKQLEKQKKTKAI